PLKFVANRGLRVLPPQTAAQCNLSLDITHSPTNILLVRVKLGLTFSGVRQPVFHLCESIFVKEQFHNSRITLSLTPQLSNLSSEQADLGGKVRYRAAHLVLGLLNWCRFDLIGKFAGLLHGRLQRQYRNS